MNTKRSQRILIILGCAFIGAVVLLVIEHSFIQKMNQDIVDIENELYIQQRQEEQAIATAAFISTFADRQNELASFVVQNGKDVATVSAIVDMIESLGNQAGVETVRVAQVGFGTQEKTKYETLSVDVSANGSWDSIIHLLTLLEHIPFRGETRSIRLGKVGQIDPPVWNMNATVSLIIQ